MTNLQNDLTVLAKQINDDHQQAASLAKTCLDYAKKSLEFAKKCGDALIEAKEIVPHGEFMTWREQNCNASHRQADKYMKLARNFALLDPDIDGLSLTTALKAIKDQQEESSVNPEDLALPESFPLPAPGELMRAVVTSP